MFRDILSYIMGGVAIGATGLGIYWFRRGRNGPPYQGHHTPSAKRKKNQRHYPD